MIRKVRVENYKSIPDLTLDLGRVTVLIGANGSGKTNILEAIALASAGSVGIAAIVDVAGATPLSPART